MLALLGTSVAAREVPQQSTAAPVESLVGVPDDVDPMTLFHTLATDFFVQRDGTIYVQTGDIPAMWLRDSAAQTLPYVRLASARPTLRSWIRAVIAREARNIEVDPYANAFRADYSVWERKWEVDSLAYPVVLAWSYEHSSHDTRVFTPHLHHALQQIVATYDCERHHARCSHYTFPAASGGDDRGPAPETGLIWSAFRASDDATQYGYNVPEQMLAETALRDVEDLAIEGYGDAALAASASSIVDGIEVGLKRYGTIYDFHCGGLIYTYEVDGAGNNVFFDDANIPSLLAAPLVGFASIDDPLYERTRRCVLSKENPQYVFGRYASGIGSPHTPTGFIWPLAMIARALTSDDPLEISTQLHQLALSAGTDGLIHESFDPSDPKEFTRAEFGWANAMYAELLFRTAADFRAERTRDGNPGMFSRTVAYSISVVDPVTALENRGMLLTAFERAVPLGMVGSDDDE